MGIIALHPEEGAESDVLRLTGLTAPGLTARLDTELEEIAEMLSRVALAHAEGKPEAMRRAASRLGARCGALGLLRVARVARTVERLATEADETALAANVARLDRLGHATLHAIWSLQDMPG